MGIFQLELDCDATFICLRINFHLSTMWLIDWWMAVLGAGRVPKEGTIYLFLSFALVLFNGLDVDCGLRCILLQ